MGGQKNTLLHPKIQQPFSPRARNPHSGWITMIQCYASIPSRWPCEGGCGGPFRRLRGRSPTVQDRAPRGPSPFYLFFHFLTQQHHPARYHGVGAQTVIGYSLRFLQKDFLHSGLGSRMPHSLACRLSRVILLLLQIECPPVFFLPQRRIFSADDSAPILPLSPQQPPPLDGHILSSRSPKGPVATREPDAHRHPVCARLHGPGAFLSDR